MKRRSFLINSLYASAIMAGAGKSQIFAESQPKHILVLGGTFFLGPAFVEAALADGHTVTLFNRGVTNPELFPNVEKLKGFRSADADDQNVMALGRRHWDVVIDVWPHDPALTESTARLLKDRTNHYLYVSSIGAYDSIETHQIQILTEDAALAPWNGSGGWYSRGKAESERRLHEIIGKRLTIVRPGAIKGMRDDTPDILGWLRRMERGGSVIAPGDGTGHVEIVDVRDVADFLVLAIDRSIYGTFNLTGKSTTFRQFLEGCQSATHSNAELVWISEPFLREQGLEQQDVSNWFRSFPYWNPDPSTERIRTSQKAFDSGWETRPFRDTAIEYLVYIASLANYDFRDTLAPAKQEEVLRLWKNRPH